MTTFRALLQCSATSLLLFAAFTSGPQRTMGYRWCVHPTINCAFNSQKDCQVAARRAGGWCELTLTIEGDPARKGTNRPR
jgi:hypothetical protein